MNNIPEKVHSKDLAAFIGVTHRRIHQYADEGVIPKGVEAIYPFAESIRGLLNKEDGRKAGGASERLNTAKAKREERKDRIEEGETMQSQDVYRVWENIVLAVRERVLKIGNNVQSKCGATEEQRKTIEQEASDALKELEKQLIYMAELEEAEDDKPQPNSK